MNTDSRLDEWKGEITRAERRADMMMANATREDRDFTPEEETKYNGLLAEIAHGRKRIDKAQSDAAERDAIDRLSGGSAYKPTAARTFGAAAMAGPLGEYLTKTKGTRQRFDSPFSEVDRAVFRATTLTEDPASGGGLVPPDFQPGVHGSKVLPVVVADLIRPGATSSNVVPVTIETSYTNAAAPVLETGLKPESALTYVSVIEPVRKIAHWIPVSNELLDDAPAAAGQIDSRLRYGVLRKEDQQLLFGTGIAPELPGIFTRSGLAPNYARGASQTNADAIFSAAMLIQSTSGYRVSAVIMNPLVWGEILMAKDEEGRYIGAGPFAGLGPQNLWNWQIALSDQVPVTEALIGAFWDAAQTFRNGGVRVDMSNSHADFFTRNLVAIRAEERLALAVYVPAAFGKVTGLTAIAPPV